MVVQQYGLWNVMIFHINLNFDCDWDVIRTDPSANNTIEEVDI